jgi:hypothetical protein
MFPSDSLADVHHKQRRFCLWLRATPSHEAPLQVCGAMDSPSSQDALCPTSIVVSSLCLVPYSLLDVVSLLPGFFFVFFFIVSRALIVTLVSRVVKDEGV